jgi:DNA-binding CsgD family transcriptional regulator
LPQRTIGAIPDGGADAIGRCWICPTRTRRRTQEAAMFDLAHAISPDAPVVQVFRVSGPSDVVRYPRSASSCQTHRPLCLTTSEREVLTDAARGLTVDESARVRGKGSETVKTQRASALLKLGARNMVHAVSLLIAERDCSSSLGETGPQPRRSA